MGLVWCFQELDVRLTSFTLIGSVGGCFKYPKDVFSIVFVMPFSISVTLGKAWVLNFFSSNESCGCCPLSWSSAVSLQRATFCLSISLGCLGNLHGISSANSSMENSPVLILEDLHGYERWPVQTTYPPLPEIQIILMD